MLNFKSIGKELKKEQPIFWFRIGDFNYLFTGYWGFKTKKVLHFEKGIFTTLINKFKAIPDKESGYELDISGKVKPLVAEKIQNFINVLEVPEKAEDVKLTNLVRIDFDKETSILKASEGYIYMNRKYMGFIELNESVSTHGSSSMSPVYFTDDKDEEMAVILPIRYSTQPEYLK